MADNSIMTPDPATITALPRGRPSTFDEKVASEIIDRLSKGEPLSSICTDNHMPAVRTVSGWKEQNSQFKADFAQARENGADAIALDALRIADGSDSDTVTLANGTEIPDKEWILRTKLRVETRLRLLAKWFPHRYGDKLALEHDVTPNTLNSFLGNIRKGEDAE